MNLIKFFFVLIMSIAISFVIVISTFTHHSIYEHIVDAMIIVMSLSLYFKLSKDLNSEK